MVLTMVALIAPPSPPAVPPQFSPLWPSSSPPNNNAANSPPWRAALTHNGVESRSCSVQMSAVAAIAAQWLRNNTYLGDPCLLARIHHDGERPEGNVLIGAQVNDLVLWITNTAAQSVGDFIHVHRIVAEKHALLLIDGDDQALLRDLLHSLRLGHAHVDAGLQDGRGDHEDDEQHQHYVDEGCDVDVGHGTITAMSAAGHHSHWHISCAPPC